ncbi:MAG: SpoIVB peptidase S55 domain-containing protein, partial [Candidatus Latescibacteria bacterium]|nr:SpoIVB peptidase S55 domain-containing protein [Candidatus Latescibacterota bacterium]
LSMSLPPARYVALAILINIGCALAASVPTMLSQDIKVGDTGYGLTVFEGTRIDTFAVEILAVIRNRTPQQDAIVCRMTGGPLERTGILQGMSGSPVYIDGKLIGAVAWGRSFTTEPLGGITPIESMLRVGRRTLAVPGPRQHVSTPQGNRLGLESMRGDSLPPFDEPVPGWSMMPEGPGFTPLVTPVFASGMDPRSMRRLQELLGAGRFQVIQGGASGAADMADVVIEPGAALGVTLMDGDLNLGGIGTVTWVDGDTVLAFGHPMFLGGRVDFPLSKAMIYFSWPSQIISHKVGAVGPIVGAVRQDRDAAIAGKLGDIPEMLPVKVEIEGPHTTRSFNYRVIRDPDYGPRFAAMGLYNAVIAMEKAGGASTV